MFTIGPADLAKGVNNWPELEDALRSLQNKVIARGAELWKDSKFGGTKPKSGEFGIASLRANEMAHDVNASTLSGTYSFRKNIGATGWRDWFNYKVRDDVVHAFAGFAITDEVLLIDQFRMEVGDRKLPIEDIQQAQGWGKFAILFKQDEGNELWAEPKQSVLLRAYMNATGYQRLLPLGFMLYRQTDLVISET